ncbi:MAG TPA: hypothetical protein PLR74_09095, partial [Agriterribacter sp.]|nr:hypothetical protein [Agriterribacter sp.]
VKVLEVDQVRKRIALSIKQTQEAPRRQEFRKGNARPFEKKEKEPDLSKASLADALGALKKKFGK